ncbi:MAG: hypothetical protein HYS12_15915 [Planctomycetes bacterium]|nr:hypothetical protein [Planctomycetota bacterium]
MPSRSWRHWHTVRARELDEVEAAHTAIGGSGPGRRTATQQINRAYAVLLASQFQGFCRDLHTECVARLITLIPVATFQVSVRDQFLWNRGLDHGNANQGTIAGDFRRMGLRDFWSRVDADRPGNDRRRQVLDQLNEWRNAIAHQSLDPARLGGTTMLRLAVVRRWRRVCRVLAKSMDNVTRAYIQGVTGMPPW